MMDETAKRVLPPDALTDLNGQSREFRDARGGFYLTLALALVFIYLVLSAQFESFADPFVIMLSVPLSMAGALFALWMTGGTWNIYSQIGVITLGRADHQARHSDRRVRQPVAGAGRGIVRRDYVIRRCCGCGRS